MARGNHRKDFIKPSEQVATYMAHLEDDCAELDYAGVDECGDAGGDGDRELGEEGVVGRAPVALEC